MEKKGVIAISIVAVVAIVVVGIVVASALNQNDKEKEETYYYIDGNGGTSDGKTVVEWTNSFNLPDKDLFTRENYNYVTFNSKADGTGTAYWTSANNCDLPKGSTLYVDWDANYVNISGEMDCNDYAFDSIYKKIKFICGSETKNAKNTSNYRISFDGTSVEPQTPGKFANNIDLIVPDSSTASVVAEDKKITITTDSAIYTFELKDGATMEKIDDEGQDKGVKLTDYSDKSNQCYFIELDVSAMLKTP